MSRSLITLFLDVMRIIYVPGARLSSPIEVSKSCASERITAFPVASYMIIVRSFWLENSKLIVPRVGLG